MADSGGLGLTGGLVDVGNLYDCFLGIHQDLVDDTILDRYSEVRRQKYLDIVDPVSSENLRRLMQDAEAADKDALFQKLRDAKSDPSLSMKLNEVGNQGTDPGPTQTLLTVLSGSVEYYA